MKNKKIKFFKSINYALMKVDHKQIDNIKNIIQKIKKRAKMVYLFGNGASATIADHLAIDFTKAAKVKSRTFNNSALMTCYSNDYGYKNFFKECIKSYVKKEDLCIFISSSGESENVVNASKYCQKLKIKNITLTGFKKNNRLSKTGLVNLYVDSMNYNVLECVHQIILLSIVEDLRTYK